MHKPVLAQGIRPIGRTAKSRRVLIVEDNLDSLHPLLALTRGMGHDVEFAINADVALDKVRRFKPHFVLLEKDLPGLDAYEFCSAIKREASLSKACIVALIGYDSEEHRAQILGAGCDLYLVKPISPEALFDLLESPLSD